MAVPNSGQLSLNSIYNELDDNDYAGGTINSNVSLKNLSTGGNPPNETINTDNDAADRPNGSAPHAMSEFYSYDHDVTAVWTATWIVRHSDISGSKWAAPTPSNTMPSQTVQDQLLVTVSLSNVSNDHFSVMDSTIDPSSSNIQFWIASAPGNLPPSSSIGMAVANSGDPGTSGTSGRGATGWKYGMATFPKSPTFTADSHGVGAAEGTWYIRLCNSGSNTASGLPQVRELYIGNHEYTSSMDIMTHLVN